MSDRDVVLVAGGVWLGAALRVSVPAVVVGLLVFVGFWFRRPPIVMCAGWALASMLAAATPTEAALPVGDYSGEVTLASDPEPITRGIRLDVDLQGVRLEAVAFGAPAGDLRARLLGERLHVTGSVAPLESPNRWAELRGLRGRLAVDDARGVAPGRVHHRIANAIRRTIASGASVLPRDQQVLLVGLVYGDDRHHSALQRDDFAAAGLTHLLAVSGQNVAFTLVLLGPLLRRFDYRGRFVLTLGVLFVFATLTRFEPSVLRASAMAAVAALAVVTARPASSLRILALAVAAVILLDTTIVSSVAFQLSVAASLGILLLSPHLAPLVRGPRLFGEAVAVTAGAQLAVAPLLLWRFDDLPVASLPANVLAGPAAGPVMMWGLTGGIVAGVVPALAPALHVPTRVGVGWIEWIAALAARVPLGSLRTAHMLVLLAGLLCLFLARRRRVRRVALALIAGALLAPAIALAVAQPGNVTLDGGTIAWRDEQIAVIEPGSARLEDLLAELRRARVTRADVVVLRRGNLADWDRLQDLRRRVNIDEVWAPHDRTIPHVIVPANGTTLQVGTAAIQTRTIDGSLELVEVTGLG